MKQSEQDFLQSLQQQAALQSKLSTTRVLPSQLDHFTTFVGNYPWQTILVLSGLSALASFVLSMKT